jgi:hypothetical protein
VKTLTGTDLGVARSDALRVKRSWLALTTVVVRAVPSQRATDVATKPLPFTVTVTSAVPATALEGERFETLGTGAG